jgi:hypothetical protein
MSDVSTSDKAVRVFILLVVIAAIYGGLVIVFGSWLWIGVGGIAVALLSAGADRLVQTAWNSTPPREPIRLAPIHSTEKQGGQG